MSNTAQSFVTCIPSTEEEMMEICREIARQNQSAANFENKIECIEQLANVMRWYLETYRKK